MWEEFRDGALPVPQLTNLACYEEIGLDLLLNREGQTIPPEAYAAELVCWNAAEQLPPDARLWPAEPQDTPASLPFTRAA
jgi:hypothetical protein